MNAKYRFFKNLEENDQTNKTKEVSFSPYVYNWTPPQELNPTKWRRVILIKEDVLNFSCLSFPKDAPSFLKFNFAE